MSDAVSKLTPLGVIVLALLREGDMHPYEMLRLLRKRGEDRLVTLTNGTFYHTVGRLERDGLLAEVGTDRDGNRPERTTYTLTDAGRTTVEDWVRAELPRIDRPTQFGVALSEGHNLEGDEVAALLRRRCDVLAAEVTDISDRLARAREHGAPEQVLVYAERECALIDAELRWTGDLIDRIESGALPWGLAAMVKPQNYEQYREAARQ
jgi:DNA-binding PadR family transcriptional regulator